MSQPDSRPKIAAIQPGGKITVVEDGDLRICVRETVEESRHGPRHMAELTALGHQREIAVVEAYSLQDLHGILEAALGAFANSVRMRRRATR
jgi:hypothetical protein